MKHIHINGRRWQDSYGNTYHSVKIWVNGEYVGTVPYTYGYDRQYFYTAINHLKDLGIISSNLSQFKDGSATYTDDVVDVARKKDL